MSRVDRVFLSIHRGELADDIAAGRPVPVRLFPGEKVVRAVGLLADTVAGVARQIRGELGWQGVLLAGVAVVTLARWL